MNVTNNLSSMLTSEMKINQMASNLSTVASSLGDAEFQEFAADFTDSIVGQIPEIIAYTANAKGIEVQNATADTLLNIKA